MSCRRQDLQKTNSYKRMVSNGLHTHYLLLTWQKRRSYLKYHQIAITYSSDIYISSLWLNKYRFKVSLCSSNVLEGKGSRRGVDGSQIAQEIQSCQCLIFGVENSACCKGTIRLPPSPQTPIAVISVECPVKYSSLRKGQRKSRIGHFWVTFCLRVKTNIRAKP